MDDSTFITIAIILCLTALIITILYYWSKQKQKDKKEKINPVIVAFLISSFFLMLSFIAELTGIFEKGWTSRHLYIFAILFFLYIGLAIISFFLFKIKPFPYRYEKALKFLQDFYSADEIVNTNENSTIKTCPNYNQTFLYGDNFLPMSVDVFYFKLKSPNLTNILIVQDLKNCDIKHIYYNVPQNELSKWLAQSTVNIDSINQENKDEDDDNMEVKQN